MRAVRAQYRAGRGRIGGQRIRARRGALRGAPVETEEVRRAQAGVGGELYVAAVATSPGNRQLIGQAATRIHAVRLDGGAGNIMDPYPVAARVIDLGHGGVIVISPRRA